jgi:hypothetical protein
MKFFSSNLGFTKNLTNETNTTNTLKSLDSLLDSLSFAPWMSIATTYVLTILNFLGVIGCSLSLWIFYRKKFADSVFFYYRLLCIINIIYLLHNIPACVLFTPRYFPHVNTWSIAVYRIYYACLTNLLFHYGDVLQMGILLARMKIYSPFVKKHFSASPCFISFAFFITCLLIDSPLPFSFKVINYGDYFYSYYNESQLIMRNDTLFYYGASEFNESKVGKILIGFNGIVLNIFGSLVAGVTLNIVSYIKYKFYIKERDRKEEELRMRSMQSQPCTSTTHHHEQKDSKKLNQKEMNEQKAEKNMFYMIITLCIISIVSRVILICGNLYALFFFSLSNIWSFVVLEYFIYSLVPALSIFVFYAFNKLFRKEFKKLFGIKTRKTHVTGVTPNSSSLGRVDS